MLNKNVGEDQIARPFAHDVVGDRQITASRIGHIGNSHYRNPLPRRLPAIPANPPTSTRLTVRRSETSRAPASSRQNVAGQGKFRTDILAGNPRPADLPLNAPDQYRLPSKQDLETFQHHCTADRMTAASSPASETSLRAALAPYAVPRLGPAISNLLTSVVPYVGLIMAACFALRISAVLAIALSPACGRFPRSHVHRLP